MNKDGLNSPPRKAAPFASLTLLQTSWRLALGGWRLLESRWGWNWRQHRRCADRTVGASFRHRKPRNRAARVFILVDGAGFGEYVALSFAMKSDRTLRLLPAIAKEALIADALIKAKRGVEAVRNRRHYFVVELWAVHAATSRSHEHEVGQVWKPRLWNTRGARKL